MRRNISTSSFRSMNPPFPSPCSPDRSHGNRRTGLLRHQLLEHAALREQRLVGAILNQTTAFEYDNAIKITGERKITQSPYYSGSMSLFMEILHNIFRDLNLYPLVQRR